MANLEHSSSSDIELKRLSSSSNNQKLTAPEMVDSSTDQVKEEEMPELEKADSCPKIASVDSKSCLSHKQKMNLSATTKLVSASQDNEIGDLSASIGILKEETSASLKKEEKSDSVDGEKMSAPIRSEDRVKELLIEIMENVGSGPTSKCCIYRVPKDIRRINKKAYTPQLVSIGPLHHGKEKLAEMEKQKRGYVKSFFDRRPPGKDNELITFVLNNEQLIRDSYAETIKLESPYFVMMIMCDALFIIEYILRAFYNGDDSWPYVPAVLIALSLDLQLLENQLPYFILEGIYNLAYEEVTFLEICKEFFKCAFSLEFPDQTEVKHFTDAIRTALVKNYPDAVEPKGMIRDLPCALELHESGVKFKNTEGKGLLDVRFEKVNGLAPCLKAPELHIPRFAIDDSTECRFRNVMALEQCHYPSDTKVCNYIWLMDSFINTEKDVELLVAKKIISNAVGDNAEVANMINKLNSHIILAENSCYYKACEELKAHCQNRWKKTKATLRRVYFTNLWTGTATVAAVLLLILTAIQTICSIFQVT